jgi:hypothetical protein
VKGVTKGNPMSHYLLSMYYDTAGELPPDELQGVMERVGALAQEMQEKGVWVFGNGLHPASTATVVQAKDGQVITTDGPYLETKEHLGGFDIIAADDLDAALAWGAKLSEATGLPIEVRPFYDR